MIIAAAVIISYCSIYSKISSDESFAKIDSFEDTYKFMLGKEAETAADVDEDLSVSERLIAIYKRIAGGILSDAQRSLYSYKRIKKKVVIAVIAATLIAYLCSAFSMSIDSVFIRTSRGSATLQALFDRLDGDADRTEVQWESSQARYIENAKTLAALIDGNRSLQNEAWLKEASEIIDANYIMIFDADGNELISDSDFRGISLKNRSEKQFGA